MKSRPEKTRTIATCAFTLIMLSPACFGADYEECFALNRYFNMPAREIHGKIDEYERRLAQDPGDDYLNLAIGILYATIAANPDAPESGASSKSVEYTDAVLKRKPDSVLALVFSGLGHSLKSRDSKNPLTQLHEVKSAVSAFDRAVTNPDGGNYGWYARYMRGNFYMNLPAYFNKREIAESDFAFMLDLYDGDPRYECFMGVGFYYLGEIEKSRGNIALAANYWKESVRIDGKFDLRSREARLAADELAAIR